MVLGKPFFRLANGADDFRAQILFAADPVVDFFCERIVKQPVDGEITALRIGLGAGENDFLRAAAVPVIRLGAERGDLELLFAFDHNHHAEFAPDGDGAFEEFFDLLRLGVRGDVVILRFASEQKIAHAAADPERGEARRVAGARQCLNANSRVEMAARSGHLRFTIYDLRANCQSTRQSQIANRKSFVAPDFFDVRDAAFDGFDGQRRAEFKNLDVLRLHERLELRVINRAGAGRGVVVVGKFHVMNVKAGQAGGQRLKLLRVLDETEVFLDLRVAGVVPVNDVRTVKVAEEIFEVAVQRNFLERLAVFDAELEAAFFGFGQNFPQRVINPFNERFLLRLALGGGFVAEFPVWGRILSRRFSASRTACRCNPSTQCCRDATPRPAP